MNNSIKNAEFRERELNDQIDGLTDQINNEKDVREMWIKRFEGEQKQASSSSSNILQMRAEIQDLELQIANLQTKVKTQTEQSDYMTEELSVA